MKLSYKAVTSDGRKMQGLIEARNADEAAKYLRSKSLIPVEITPKKEFQFNFKIGKSQKQLVFFTRQLSSMITAGLTLIQSLRTLEAQMQAGELKKIISAVVKDIEDGNSFADSLSKYPKYFDTIYIALIRAAETSGLLDKILTRLADNLEKEAKIKSSIKGALLYPVIVVIGMILVMSIMMIVIIPELTPIYTQLHIQLPVTTLIVIAISNFIIGFWYVLILLLIGLFFIYKFWSKTVTGKLFTNSLALKLPVFGKLNHDTILTETTRTLGILIGSGILVVDAIKQSAEVSGNIIYTNAYLAVAKNVEKGIPIGESMSYSSLFPPILVEMVKVGEQTGKLDDSLSRVSLYYEQEVDARIKALTTLLEPFIITALGFGVAFLMFAVITPLYSILNGINS